MGSAEYDTEKILIADACSAGGFMYNDEVQKTLRKLQLAELNIIKLFMKICEKEHLRYFMIGGTMLGAIRHKGFIPWDDDVDIGMPREDYDRLFELLKDGTYLPENFEFLNYKIKDDYKRYFSRIVDNRVLVYNASGGEEIVEAAWIDIFPLDGSPNNYISCGNVSGIIFL